MFASEYPSDCNILLESMINISIKLDLSMQEIDILSQRMEYLSTPNHLAEPILYIHIPKTGGTGFGRWLETNSGKRTQHVWIPKNMIPSMFDDRTKRNSFIKI